MKGYFGFTAPTADKAFMTAVDTDCSRYPSIGSEVLGTGCFKGGSLFGSDCTSYK